MKKLLICATAAVFMLSCNNEKKNTDATSTSDTTKMATAEKPADAPEAVPDSAAMMKAWKEYMTPGEEHKMLAKSNGKWSEEVKMYMSPGAPPDVMNATCENSMIMNGLYQSSVTKGMYNGMPFEGRSTFGFNNATKKYQSTWIDNMGSGMMHMEGTWDSTAKMLVMTGVETDPMTGKDMAVKETMKFTDDNHQVMEMFETRGGKESKVMEINFKKP